MEATQLVQICGIAFLAVFTILSFLAVSMKLITTLFRVKMATIDSTVVAVLSSSVATVFPGAMVTKIEEES